MKFKNRITKECASSPDSQAPLQSTEHTTLDQTVDDVESSTIYSQSVYDCKHLLKLTIGF
jgi:hypothetical protein